MMNHLQTIIEGLKGIKIGKPVSTIEINRRRTRNCALYLTECF